MQDYRTSSNQPDIQLSKAPAPTSWSILLIIIANIVPLIGVIFFGWSLANVIILYWIENIIIGIWNIPRILYAGKQDTTRLNYSLAIFFIFHYGIFCCVHGIFIFSILGIKESPLVALNKGVLIAAATMFITTGLAFYQDYIATKDYRHWTPSDAMHFPYRHILVIHIAIILAAIVVKATGSAMALLILLIIGKTALELSRKKRDIH